MGDIKHKIDADAVSLNTLLSKQKFFIDYFQREYRWQEKHIKTLVDDLCEAFMIAYSDGDAPLKVENYPTYYLGPIVLSCDNDDAKLSIIDGQQRIISITLFLMYLEHLQKQKLGQGNQVPLMDMVYSAPYGVKSFNLSEETRIACMNALLEFGDYSASPMDDETVENMVERYHDIENVFPDDIADKSLECFLYWLINKVIVVKIVAYSDENAYAIFESMNDRGLNLTMAEMLKGFVLSRVSDRAKRSLLDGVWKDCMQRLHTIGDNADTAFFQALFRAKYAQKIRQGKAGSKDEDFELIGSRFHSWFKDNYEALMGLDSEEKLFEFFQVDMPFYVKWYLRLYSAKEGFDAEAPSLSAVSIWGIADSLQEPLILAPLNPADDDAITLSKMNSVALYIESFTVRRAINYRRFNQSSIKYTMFNVIKQIRGNEVGELGDNLEILADRIDESWDGIDGFSMHGQNKRFVKFFLSRISSYVDELAGIDTNFCSYYQKPIKGRPFEIEHIWADKHEYHAGECPDESSFHWNRNRIGALVLLPNGKNQAYQDSDYPEKLPHYIKENTLVASLNDQFYQKNPAFMNNPVVREVGFKAHQKFCIADIEERNELLKKICQEIWI